jgi:imidazole glycerol-phosphate synthase subunit HisF
MTLKTRIIPCLLLKNGLIVRSELFKYHQIIGDPISQLTRYNQWSADELIYIDISTDGAYDVRRNDARIDTSGKTTFLEIVSEISRHCFVPLTVGGRIRSIEDMSERFANGADKIVINTLAIEHPDMIAAAANSFGSQAVVVSIDVLRGPDGTCRVMVGGRQPTDLDPVAWAREVERRGAGEILVNSVDRDGSGRGYDIDLVREMVEATTIPVIAMGGCGRWSHMKDVLEQARPAAVAAANIFHFTELSYKEAKKVLAKSDIPLRMPARVVGHGTSSKPRPFEGGTRA